MVCGVESVSEHPVAKAITKYGLRKRIKIKIPRKFEEFAGFGIRAFFDKEKVAAGNLRFLRNEKVKITRSELTAAQDYQRQGYQVVFLGVGRKLAAFVVLSDEIRPEASLTISSLRSFGVRDIVMLTGDNELVAERVAKQIGIVEFHANLLPEGKLNFVRDRAEKTGGKVAMVGDGVNDAASLKLADIGIAMGVIGADSAIESADIALMQDNLLKIIQTIKLSRFTRRVARQNFGIWGTVNVVGLFLVLSHAIGPTGAAFYNFITDFFPIMNALRVFRYKMN
jgi:P-type E1-E2 ATPase